MRNDGFGLYIHWPYCEQKCPYCDFNSYARKPEDASVWTDAYVNEVHRSATEVGPQILSSIYFGGGTPSLMAPSTVAAIIDAAQNKWSFANDIEITLEANPSSVERKKFEAFKSAGVNRVSLGIQAMNDSDLRQLGRLHSRVEALSALETARTVFDRTSFDLIYARQNQSMDMWVEELETALSFSPEHLSLYQLTIEPGTAFYDRFHRGGLKGLPDEDLAADMFDVTQDITHGHGLPAYEVSNHANSDNRSKHNLIYWSGGSWAGIGPGAHGRIKVDGQRIATETYLSPEGWLKRVAENGSGTRKSEVLSSDDVANEFVMMGLRMIDGIQLSRYTHITGHPLHVSEILIEQGLVHIEQGTLKVTQSGRLLLNQVIQELLI